MQRVKNLVDPWPTHKNISTKFCIMPIMNWVSQLENLTLFYANITKAQTSLHIHAVWSASLLFSIWQVQQLNLHQAKSQYSN